MQRILYIYIYIYKYTYILPHDGRIPKKDKINAYITYAQIMKFNETEFAQEILHDLINK